MNQKKNLQRGYKFRGVRYYQIVLASGLFKKYYHFPFFKFYFV